LHEATAAGHRVDEAGEERERHQRQQQFGRDIRRCRHLRTLTHMGVLSRFFAVPPPTSLDVTGGHRLTRTLGAPAPLAVGIGSTIGVGIFVLTGTVAANNAGPALTLSFLIAGLGCALAALCYSEFAAMLPVSGSAYSYAYATLGEGVAWFIGWNLILEYAL